MQSEAKAPPLLPRVQQPQRCHKSWNTAPIYPTLSCWRSNELFFAKTEQTFFALNDHDPPFAIGAQ